MIATADAATLDRQDAGTEDTPARVIHEPAAWVGPHIPAKPVTDLEGCAAEVAGRMRLRVQGGAELIRPMVETITEALNPGKSLYVRRQIAGRAWDMLQAAAGEPAPAPAPQEPAPRPKRARAERVVTDGAAAVEATGRVVQRRVSPPRWDRPAEPEREPAAPTAPARRRRFVTTAETDEARALQARAEAILRESPGLPLDDLRLQLAAESGEPLSSKVFRTSVWNPLRDRLGLHRPRGGGVASRRDRTPREMWDPAPRDGLRTPNEAGGGTFRAGCRDWLADQLRERPDMSWEDARLALARRFSVWYRDGLAFRRSIYDVARTASGIQPTAALAPQVAALPAAAAGPLLSVSPVPGQPGRLHLTCDVDLPAATAAAVHALLAGAIAPA